MLEDYRYGLSRGHLSPCWVPSSPKPPSGRRDVHDHGRADATPSVTSTRYPCCDEFTARRDRMRRRNHPRPRFDVAGVPDPTPAPEETRVAVEPAESADLTQGHTMMPAGPYSSRVLREVVAVGHDARDRWHEASSPPRSHSICGRCRWCLTDDLRTCSGRPIRIGSTPGAFAEYVRLRPRIRAARREHRDLGRWWNPWRSAARRRHGASASRPGPGAWGAVSVPGHGVGASVWCR